MNWGAVKANQPQTYDQPQLVPYELQTQTARHPIGGMGGMPQAMLTVVTFETG